MNRTLPVPAGIERKKTALEKFKFYLQAGGAWPREGSDQQVG